MKQHLTRSRIVAVVAAIAALAGAGVTLARMSAPVPDTVASLHERLLLPTELPGFAPHVCALVETDAARWASGYPSVAGLRRNGFLGGLREPLQGTIADARAVTSVAHFASAEGARHELEDELGAARRASRGFAAFPVAGIPGARGFMVRSGGAKRYSVLFSDEGYLHVVTVGFSSSAAEQPSRSRVAGVAAALYRRVHELR